MKVEKKALEVKTRNHQRPSYVNGLIDNLKGSGTALPERESQLWTSIYGSSELRRETWQISPQEVRHKCFEVMPKFETHIETYFPDIGVAEFIPFADIHDHQSSAECFDIVILYCQEGFIKFF